MIKSYGRPKSVNVLCALHFCQKQLKIGLFPEYILKHL